ncbi:MAG: SPOR domain-containing protein [Pseudomonadota bacterium]
MTNEFREDTRIEADDKFFCRFTFGQFFALLIFEAFILFFIFYLGARYGRTFLGMDVARQAAETSQARVLSTEDPEVRKLADELMKKSGKPVQLKERIAEMLKDTKLEDDPPSIRVKTSPMPQPHTEAPTEVERNPTSDDDIRPVTTISKRGSSDQSTTSTNKNDVIRIKTPSQSRYSIQIGSYPKMSEASDMVQTLKGKGYPAYMMIADIPDRGRWYRVRVGAFGTHDEADNFLANLKRNEKVEALIVLNEN